MPQRRTCFPSTPRHRPAHSALCPARILTISPAKLTRLKSYWQFYWPLALTGLAMVLSVQFQNAALARYPDAVRELAVFALAYGTFGFFRASLNFIAQLSNVFARSPAATVRCLKFVAAVSAGLTVPLLGLATSEWGMCLLRTIYGIDTTLALRVVEYLLYLSPLIVMHALRFHFTGLLVQARLTGTVTTLNVLFLTLVGAGLVAGFNAGFDAVSVLVGSEGFATLVHLIASFLAVRWRYTPPAVEEHADVTYGELLRFYVPVSTTGVMFALSRPVLFALVSRTPGGVLTIAALRVAFDFSMLFQQAANQFRHFFVTFGLDDLPAKRRFMTIICGGITLIMLAFAVTPLGAWIWSTLIGIPDDVRVIATEVILVMCLMPTAIMVRNYYHGHLMVERRTSGMAYGGILRVAAIYALSQLALLTGTLNHITAGLILVLGFVAETAVVLIATRRSAGETIKEGPAS